MGVPCRTCTSLKCYTNCIQSCWVFSFKPWVNDNAASEMLGLTHKGRLWTSSSDFHARSLICYITLRRRILYWLICILCYRWNRLVLSLLGLSLSKHRISCSIIHCNYAKCQCWQNCTSWQFRYLIIHRTALYSKSDKTLFLYSPKIKYIINFLLSLWELMMLFIFPLEPKNSKTLFHQCAVKPQQ